MTGGAYLLADDLSGALEAGAPWRAAGWDVHVPLEPVTALVSGSPGRLDVVVTGTRQLPAADAAFAVRRLVRARQDAGSRLLGKKIDSTLRGPIGAELVAVQQEVAPPLTLLCPAHPAVGRTVEGGRVFVQGVPLEETAFARDPGCPARTGDVVARLKEEGVAHVAVLPRSVWVEGGRPFAALLAQMRDSAGVLVADVAQPDDWAVLWSRVLAFEPLCLGVGSGAMLAALAARQPRPLLLSPPAGPPARAALVVAGSRHPATHAQVDHLAARGMPVCTLSAVDEVPDWTGMHASPVRVVRFAASAEVSPVDLQDALAGIVDAAVGQGNSDLLYLTGGETAAVIARRLQGTDLVVLRELEPGVVLSLLLRAQGNPLLILTKPGGYGQADAIGRHLAEVMK